jgi:NADH dehydrogenase
VPAKRHRVVIIGGGFAGVACARGLSSRRFDVSLLDLKTSFEFLPNIHELLSAVKSPQTLQLPLKPLLDSLGHRFRRAKVIAIDPQQRVVVPARGKPIPYDSLVLAAGAADATYGIPGVSEHSLPFKSVADSALIGKRLARLARSKYPANVVVVGGGLAGVEALGEILRGYRHSGLNLTLVEAQDRVLPQAPAALDRHIREVCSDLPVTLRCGSPVGRLKADTVTLADGGTLPSDLTIWTGGPAPPSLLAQSGLAGPGGWAPVDKNLRSTLHEGVYIPGDAAQLPRPQPRQAYHALDMGVCVARNLERSARGRRLASYRPAAKPVLVSFGDLSSILIVGDCALAGPALGAGKEMIFELVMAQLDKRHGTRPLIAALGRGDRAFRRLLWPTVTSLTALRRQADLMLLS